jgi:hypothetical protein
MIAEGLRRRGVVSPNPCDFFMRPAAIVGGMERFQRIMRWLEALLWLATFLDAVYWFQDIESIGRALVVAMLLATSIATNAFNWLLRHRRYRVRDILVATTWVAVIATILVGLFMA